MLFDQLQIREDSLRCSPEKLNHTVNYITPDIQFRLLSDEKHTPPTLDVRWFVKTREDVGYFEVMVRNSTSGSSIDQVYLPYSARTISFPKIPNGNYHVCVSTRDSNNQTRFLRRGQCDFFTVNLSRKIEYSLDLLLGSLIFLII